MGSLYLSDLADVCRRTSYPVVEVGSSPSRTGDEWKRRGRSGNTGYESGRPSHVMVHHTASSRSADGWDDANYCTFNSSNKPVCNLLISRMAEIFVCAAGPTNTNGSGGDPCGMANDSMNSHAIGIEASNDGIGEVWSSDMLDCYNRLCAELCTTYGIPTGRIHSHWEYAAYRGKIDPAGPPRPTGGGPAPLSWNMNAFRSDVEAIGGGGGPPPFPPTPGDDDMAEFIIGYAGADTDGAMYATDLHTKTWLVDSAMVSAKEAVIAMSGGDPSWRSIGDAQLFKAYGPIVGPRPNKADEWGLPT